LEQSRFTSRTDYCYTLTTQEFPFVFGYILFHELYGISKKNATQRLVESVLFDGIYEKIQEAEWIKDISSLEASLKKVENLGTFIGYPPSIAEWESVDKYYRNVSVVHCDFLTSIQNLNDFDVYVLQHSFTNSVFDMGISKNYGNSD